MAINLPTPDISAAQAEPMVQGPADQAQSAITEAYQKLRAMVSSMPQIDYQKMYAPLMQQVQNQPETKPMGALSTFAAAVGAPRATENRLSSQFETIAKEREQKHRDIIDLQSKALEGHIGQLMEEGKFKQALGQSETLAKLNDTLGRIDSAEKQKRELETLREKAKLQQATDAEKAKQKKDLEADRAKNAMNRVKAVLQGRKDLSASQKDQYTTTMASVLKGLLLEKDIAGDPVYTPEEAAQIALRAVPAIKTGAAGLRPEGGAPPPAPAAAGSTGTTDPIRAAHEKLFKGK